MAPGLEAPSTAALPFTGELAGGSPTYGSSSSTVTDPFSLSLDFLFSCSIVFLSSFQRKSLLHLFNHNSCFAFVVDAGTVENKFI